MEFVWRSIKVTQDQGHSVTKIFLFSPVKSLRSCEQSAKSHETHEIMELHEILTRTQVKC